MGVSSCIVLEVFRHESNFRTIDGAGPGADRGLSPVAAGGVGDATAVGAAAASFLLRRAVISARKAEASGIWRKSALLAPVLDVKLAAEEGSWSPLTSFAARTGHMSTSASQPCVSWAESKALPEMMKPCVPN